MRQGIPPQKETVNVRKEPADRHAEPPQTSRFEDPQAPAYEDAQRPKSAPPRLTPSDLEDIGNSLLDGLKKRNRDKSNAFSEFEKRHKNW